MLELIIVIRVRVSITIICDNLEVLMIMMRVFSVFPLNHMRLIVIRQVVSLEVQALFIYLQR
jgi:hypothetical protein